MPPNRAGAPSQRNAVGRIRSSTTLLLALVVAIVSGLCSAVRSRPRSAFSAVTFTVTSAGDGADALAGDGICDDGSGACTLRAAIMEANAVAGTYVIVFDIGAGGNQSITPSTPLPPIVNATTIDGQPLAGSHLSCDGVCIELSGGSCSGCSDGLVLTAGSSTIHEMVINRFTAGAGVVLMGPGGGNSVADNLIGTDRTGSAAEPNGGPGVLIDGSSNNTISGNTISGNAVGVLIRASAAAGASNNIVEGGEVGMNQAGSAAIPNAGAGVEIDGSGTQTVSANRVSAAVSGNSGPGISIHGGEASGNLVQNSQIGVAAPNGSDGISISGGAHGNVAGCPIVGWTPSCLYPDLDTIAHNHGAGISIGDWPAGNTVSGVETYDNDGLGIDITPVGMVTRPWDAELSSSLYCPAGCMGLSSGMLSITGYGHGEPQNTSFFVDPYWSASCDSSGYGEGQTRLVGNSYLSGSTTSDGNGDATANAVVWGPPDVGPSMVGRFLTMTLTPPDGSTAEYGNCIQVKSDADSDGIEDSIDGPGGASSGTFSSDFDTRPLGGTAFGTIADRANCYISVTVAGTASTYNPADGVVLGDVCPNGSSGPATVSLCGTGSIELTDGLTVTENCHSLDTDVGVGPVTETFGPFAATLPTNTQSTVQDLGGGSYRVTNEASSEAPLVAGGQSVAPGATITLPAAPPPSVGGIAELPSLPPAQPGTGHAGLLVFLGVLAGLGVLSGGLLIRHRWRAGAYR